MDGFMLTVSSEDQRHHALLKKKTKVQEWRKLFLKLDDITAKLVAFSDRSQSEVCWSVQLVGADISTPVPGESNYGLDVDNTPYCFYVRETNAIRDCAHFFSAPNDATKKAWMKALLQIARDGPRAPRFTFSQAENEFEFHARVVKFRPHVDGTHAEYLVTCSCQVFSKLVARRLSKEWSLWRRFSEFDELNEALKKTLGTQMEGIDIVKHKRDAFRGVLGKAFDHEFLEERRLLLDSFVSRVCSIRTAVDFFKHHSDAQLKKFFEFDNNCQDVDQTPRKAKGSRSRSKGSSSATHKSEDDTGRVSTDGESWARPRTSDATSKGGRSRSKGSQSSTQKCEDGPNRLSTSSCASEREDTKSRTHSRASTISSATSEGDDVRRSHHRSHHQHREKDPEQAKKRPRSKKRDKQRSGKREPTASFDGAGAEIRRADPVA